jgi:hypothetical protein
MPPNIHAHLCLVIIQDIGPKHPHIVHGILLGCGVGIHIQVFMNSYSYLKKHNLDLSHTLEHQNFFFHPQQGTFIHNLDEL